MFGLGMLMCAVSMTSANAKEVQLKVEEQKEKSRTPAFPLIAERPPFEKTEAWTTPYVQSLNGKWRIKWFGKESSYNSDVSFDKLTDWMHIDVPSCEELQGYGSLDASNFAFDNNPLSLSIYQREFSIPDSWMKRPVFLRFDGVLGAYEVYVNGKKVGSTNDGYLPAEFNITDALQSGKNILNVKLTHFLSYARSCSDNVRMRGIFREVSLYSPPTTEIRDFTLQSYFEDTALLNAKLQIDVDVRTLLDTVFNGSLSAEILNDKGESMFSIETRPFELCSKNDSIKLEFPIAKIQKPYKWSADAPYLYTAILTLRDSENNIKDVRCVKHGFCQSEIRDGVYNFNGKPIKLKGVVYNEFNPTTGRSITREQMIETIIMMKRFNINTVFTGTGPLHYEFYDLCDRFGLYVVTAPKTDLMHPADCMHVNPLAENVQHVIANSRAVNHVLTYKNHPSVLVWAFNDIESSKVKNLASVAVGVLDPTRPVDIATQASLSALDSKEPCLLPSLFNAHGNGLGGMSANWELVMHQPNAMGAGVSQWMNEAFLSYTGRKDAKGQPEMEYQFVNSPTGRLLGDDDFPVIGVSGLVKPDMKETPMLREVKRVYQNIDVIPENLAEARFKLYNGFFFKNLKYFSIRWILFENGVTIERGMLDPINVRPSQFGDLVVPVKTERLNGGADYQLRLIFALNKSTRWAPRDFEIATAQFKLPPSPQAQKVAQYNFAGAQPLVVQTPAANLIKVGHNADQRFSITFDKNTGSIASFVSNGVQVIQNTTGLEAGPKLNLYRSFTSNSLKMRQAYHEHGLRTLSYHPISMSVQQINSHVVIVKAKNQVLSSEDVSIIHETTYTIFANDIVKIDNEITSNADIDHLARIGTRMFVSPKLETIHWYGCGPTESYSDRKASSDVGLNSSAVTFQYVDYLRPQENGTKNDVKWFALAEDNSRGLLFVSEDSGFALNALHYTAEDLDNSIGQIAPLCCRAPLIPRPEVVLCIDGVHAPLNNHSAGQIQLKANQPYKFSYSIRPVWCRAEQLGNMAQMKLPEVPQK